MCVFAGVKIAATPLFMRVSAIVSRETFLCGDGYLTEGLKIIPMHRSDRYSTVWTPDVQASQRKLTGGRQAMKARL